MLVTAPSCEDMRALRAPLRKGPPHCVALGTTGSAMVVAAGRPPLTVVGCSEGRPLHRTRLPPAAGKSPPASISVCYGRLLTPAVRGRQLRAKFPPVGMPSWFCRVRGTSLDRPAPD